MQIPSIGRIVHYTNLGDKDGKYPPEPQAAIITKVKIREGRVNTDPDYYIVSLHIFYPTGQFDMHDVPYSQMYERGHWSWPPKV